MTALQALAQFLSACPGLGQVDIGAAALPPCSYVTAQAHRTAYTVAGECTHTLTAHLTVRRTVLTETDAAALEALTDSTAAWVRAQDVAGRLPAADGIVADALQARDGVFAGLDDAGGGTMTLTLIFTYRTGENDGNKTEDTPQ